MDAHQEALAEATEELLEGGCEGPIPDDLYARAQRLERALFGVRTPASLPDALPHRIDLFSVRR